MKRKKIVLLSLSVLAVLATGLLIYNAVVFRMTSVSDVHYSSPFIKISFNKNINTNSVVIERNDFTENIESDKKTITVYTKNNALQAGETIEIHITNIVSENGQVITNKVLRLKVGDKSADDLPDDQHQFLLYQQDQSAKEMFSDPILNVIPKSSLNFKLEPVLSTNSDGRTIVSVNATIFLSAADVRTNIDASIDLYKQEIMDFLKQNNIDPALYIINYNIIYPTI